MESKSDHCTHQVILLLLSLESIRHDALSAGWSKKEDYYKTLGVPRSASKKEIKKAYFDVRGLSVDAKAGVKYAGVLACKEIPS